MISGQIDVSHDKAEIARTRCWPQCPRFELPARLMQIDLLVTEPERDPRRLLSEAYRRHTEDAFVEADRRIDICNRKDQMIQPLDLNFHQPTSSFPTLIGRIHIHSQACFMP